jgi:hypothetical protein
VELAPQPGVQVGDVLVLVLLGAGTTLGAAVVPAVQAGRQDVMAALAGRHDRR